MTFLGEFYADSHCLDVYRDEAGNVIVRRGEHLWAPDTAGQAVMEDADKVTHDTVRAALVEFGFAPENVIVRP